MITFVLNSPGIDLGLLRKLSRDSVLVGVDGGLNTVMAAGMTPHWAVGDFDSVDSQLFLQLPKETKVLRAPVQKDFTDFELALRLVKIHRSRRINVLGLGGGERFDHQLVNSLALWEMAERGYQVQAWSGRQKFTFTGSSHVLCSSQGKMFSVFALRQPVIVSLRGAKYSGVGLRVLPGSGLGLGNEIVGNRAVLGIRGGVVCLCQW